ncbi:hypothetical protein [Paenibacillus sp. SSG-1]|uniref:hypothetical protein n=1 Tax=Paenibacillus sp. SSG-1 TaxID=1443669 RepID=UPI00117E2806|nr:hypothetical protein [Paenibacillus sp. SSG-1]
METNLRFRNILLAERVSTSLSFKSSRRVFELVSHFGFARSAKQESEASQTGVGKVQLTNKQLFMSA